jgi:hypothetical protein
MSVNIIGIKCNKCNFHSASSRVWGRYVYELPEDVWLTIPRSAGWCYKCQNIQPIETLAINGSNFENIANDNIERKKDFSIYNAIKSFFSFQKKSKSPNTELALRDIISVRNKFLSQRHDPAKCLICGETNIEIVKLPVPMKGEKIPIDLSHQNCGGMLYAEGSDTSFHCSFASRVYDIQGNYMRTENDWR